MFKCDSCKYAKYCRNCWPLSMHKSTALFEIVHFDVWGPTPIDSLFGYRFFITFINDYSRCTWVYLHKSKSDVFLSLFLIIK